MANYTIDINIKNVATDKKVVAGDNGKDEPKDSFDGTAMALGTFVATQAIKPFLKSAINFAASNVELTTGSSGLQEQVDFAMQFVNDATGLVSTTAAGLALTGGTPIGAVIGFAVGVAQKGIEIVNKQRQINLNKAIEDRQIAYTQSRLGAQFNSSRRN